MTSIFCGSIDTQLLSLSFCFYINLSTSTSMSLYFYSLNSLMLGLAARPYARRDRETMIGLVSRQKLNVAILQYIIVTAISSQSFARNMISYNHCIINHLRNLHLKCPIGRVSYHFLCKKKDHGVLTWTRCCYASTMIALGLPRYGPTLAVLAVQCQCSAYCYCTGRKMAAL